MAQAKRSARNKARRKFIGRGHSSFETAYQNDVEWSRNKKIKDRALKFKHERRRKARDLEKTGARVTKRFGFIPAKI